MMITIKDLKFIQDNATGLFFTPVGNKSDKPTAPREKAWLYDEHRTLAIIREFYGGDHGAAMVTVIVPETHEIASWQGYKGGLRKSLRKLKQSKKNGFRNRGVKHGAAILDNAKVIEIRRKYAEGGWTYYTLGVEYKVSKFAIKNIVRGISWKHLLPKEITT